MMSSAPVRSTPASDRPAMRPSSHALPAAPAPASTSARLVEFGARLAASGRWSGIGRFPGLGVLVTAMPSDVAVEWMPGVEEGVAFMGVAFRDRSGAPGGDLPQSRGRGPRESTLCGYWVH